MLAPVMNVNGPSKLSVQANTVIWSTQAAIHILWDPSGVTDHLSSRRSTEHRGSR